MSHDEGPGAPLETNFRGEPWDSDLDGNGKSKTVVTNQEAYQKATETLRDTLGTALQEFMAAVGAANIDPFDDQLPGMVSNHLENVMAILCDPEDSARNEAEKLTDEVAGRNPFTQEIDQRAYDQAITALKATLDNALAAFNDQIAGASPQPKDQLPGMVRRRIDSATAILRPSQDTAE